MSSSSPPLVSPRSGHTASLFQNHQAPQYGWRFMLVREQEAHTALLDTPLQPRRAFHGNFAPCLERLSGQLLCRFFGTSVRGDKTVVSSSFVVTKLLSGTRQQPINQFVTDHFFSFRYCESMGLSKIEAGCRNMLSDKKTAAQNLHQERRSAALQ